MAQIAILWGILTGRRKYACYVCSTAKMTKKARKSLLTELQTNDALYRLYPREIASIRLLKGSGRKALAQTYNGRLTNVSIG